MLLKVDLYNLILDTQTQIATTHAYWSLEIWISRNEQLHVKFVIQISFTQTFHMKLSIRYVMKNVIVWDSNIISCHIYESQREIN
jgi:hypothetical protein